VKFKDGNLLKHALRHLTEFQLELELVWFLQNKREMKPTIGAALCKEVIEDFIQASFKEYGFYSALERTALQYSRREPEEVRGEALAMVEALKKLKDSFSMTQANRAYETH
jgi:hypothetical protein